MCIREDINRHQEQEKLDVSIIWQIFQNNHYKMLQQ